MEHVVRNFAFKHRLDIYGITTFRNDKLDDSFMLYLMLYWAVLHKNSNIGAYNIHVNHYQNVSCYIKFCADVICLYLPKKVTCELTIH